MFKRNADGTLAASTTVSTGGLGAAATPPFSFPIVDGSGSVNLTSDGRLLFVVNAGDNSVSSLRVTPSGLRLIDHVWSGGTLPVSLTSSGHLLYVVNELSGNIYGYRFSEDGHLRAISGSSQPLSSPGPSGVAADIGFAPDGGTLVVTLRQTLQALGTIDTFTVRHDGVAGPAQATAADAPDPFGFSFAGHHLRVSNAGFVATIPPNVGDPANSVGSASSYTSGIPAV